jgi:hypothetical protein
MIVKIALILNENQKEKSIDKKIGFQYLRKKLLTVKRV